MIRTISRKKASVTMNIENKKCITVNELSEFLGIGRATAYHLVNSEGFPSFRIGKKVLIDVDALNVWMRKGGTRNLKKYGEEEQ